MVPITQAEIKFARSLSNQKYRKESNTYLIEGDKIVKEWLVAKAALSMIIMTDEWFASNESLLQAHIDMHKVRIVPYHVIEKISAHKTAPPVLALASMHAHDSTVTTATNGWHLILDRIQDPGNMGTIIRIADWFQIDSIICGEGCVEIYNPKVIQSCMGSLLRVHITHAQIDALIPQLKLPTWAATLDGQPMMSITSAQKLAGGYVIMGNESQGVHPDILAMVKNRVTIPRLGGAESLNVSVATGILCSYLKL